MHSSSPGEGPRCPRPLVGVPPREDAPTRPSGSMPLRALGRLRAGRPQGCWSSVRRARTHPPSLPARRVHDPPHHARRYTTPEPGQSRLPTRRARALLSFHWAPWPSITEAGGRACALSAAIATACTERASARRRGESGCCAGADRGAGRGHGECCGTPVFPTYCLSCQDLWIQTFSG